MSCSHCPIFQKMDHSLCTSPKSISEEAGQQTPCPGSHSNKMMEIWASSKEQNRKTSLKQCGNYNYKVKPREEHHPGVRRKLGGTGGGLSRKARGPESRAQGPSSLPLLDQEITPKFQERTDSQESKSLQCCSQTPVLSIICKMK